MITLTPASLADLIVRPAALTAGLAGGFQGDLAGGERAVDEVLSVMHADSGALPFGVFWGERNGVYVGLASFKGAPNADGEAEIAYYVFPDVERQGIAGEMVKGLTLIAWQAGGHALVAHTLPEESASTSVLKRCGFRFEGETEHPEDGLVWAWRRPL